MHTFFREVDIPEVRGHLYLHHLPGMPGEPLADFLFDAKEAVISRVVCLVEEDERLAFAPDYDCAIAEGTLRIPVDHVPIPDGGVPPDEAAYANVVRDVANRLKTGKAVLVHCRGGIGRTGTFAIALLVSLGMSYDEAVERVRDAGSGPETREQELFVKSWALERTGD